MLRFEDIVFGPVHSRRLGSSLGVNLLPPDGKLCNFDCIYCECGWNRDGISHGSLPSPAEVRDALAAKLKDCRDKGIAVDSITFSGNGEPTLHPRFPEIVDITLEARDMYCPEAVISVLSNATMLQRKEVFVSLMKIDNPILKLDAVLDSDTLLINRPSGKYHVSSVIGEMKKFNGNFILQTMFLRGGGYDSAERSRVEGWLDVVRELRPREIMVYTIDRETPEKGLEKITAEEMEEIVRPLLDEGFRVRISG